MKQLLTTFGALLLCISYSQALECNIHMKKNDSLRDIITKCIKTNHTLEDIWNMAPMSSESDSSSSEEAPSAVDGKMAQAFRSRRAAATQAKTESPAAAEAALNSSSSDSATTTSSDSSSEAVAQNCVTQCIFQQLEMTDNTGYPLHAKMVEGLLRNVPGRELRDFIQETTGDCFQEVDKEASSLDSCSYSQKLVQCLAERGKDNCSDWPVGELPFQR